MKRREKEEQREPMRIDSLSAPLLLCVSKEEPDNSLALNAILAGFNCKCSDNYASVGGVHREVSKIEGHFGLADVLQAG